MLSPEGSTSPHSAHNFSAYGVQRPARTADSTALGRRSMARMRPVWSRPPWRERPRVLSHKLACLLESAERLELSGIPVAPLEDYERRLAAAWKNLWTGEAGRQELNLQHFLEAHPCLIPGFRSFNTDSGHAPFPAAVITQPKLPELSTKQPGFCWIATDSVWLYAVMVEIETPDKRWFIRDGSAKDNYTGISFTPRASSTTGKHGSLNQRTNDLSQAVSGSRSAGSPGLRPAVRARTWQPGGVCGASKSAAATGSPR
jgi:hypothetical protein